jgi:hypothetical protein
VTNSQRGIRHPRAGGDLVIVPMISSEAIALFMPPEISDSFAARMVLLTMTTPLVKE